MKQNHKNCVAGGKEPLPVQRTVHHVLGGNEEAKSIIYTSCVQQMFKQRTAL